MVPPKRQATVRFSEEIERVPAPAARQPQPGPENTGATGRTSQTRARVASLRRTVLGNGGQADDDDDIAKGVVEGEAIQLREGTNTTRLPSISIDPVDLPETRHSDTTTAPTDSSVSAAATKKTEKKKRQRASRVSEETNAFLPFYSQYATRYAANSPVLQRMRAQGKRFARWVLQEREYVPDPEGRDVALSPNAPAPQIERVSKRAYIDNTITTSRYTAYNFLPRQLAFQFSKIANIYFLSVSILQLIPGLSTTGTYTTIVPLSVFVSLSMAREGYDDLRRHRLDVAENNKSAEVLRRTGKDGAATWQTVAWKDLRVGDVIRLKKDDWIPADLILLQSSGEHGVAYIETAALDGETNLKSKRAIPAIDEQCNTLDGLCHFEASLHSESPNQDLYNYEGKVSFAGQEVPLTNDQIIYRGSIMRNTAEAAALIVFTGEETKIRLNASKNIRAKKPTIQKTANRIVIMIVSFVIGLSIFCTCAYYIWHSTTERRLWYLASARKLAFLPIFVSFLILYNTMVPLSLYVSMEIVKLIQQLLLQQDLDMYHAESDTPMEARTSTINEELGQVSYIFSDKTGTLTDNSMVFRKMSVAGHAWLHDLDIQKRAAEEKPFLLHKLRKGKKSERSNSVSHALHPVRSNSYAEGVINQRTRRGRASVSAASPRVRKSTSSWYNGGRPHEDEAEPELASTNDLIEYVQTHPHTLFARRARLFMLSIALCHTCLPEYAEGTDARGNTNPTYSAASPDELALVSAAVDLGYIVRTRSAHSLILRTYPQGFDSPAIDETYTVKDVIEFSSARKRMSVIVQFPDGRHCVLCKGADSFLVERMRLKELADQKWKEVERQAQLRQSMEVERAIARKSMSRPSMALPRPSMSKNNRLDMIRDLDEFLETRHEDSAILDEQLGPRPSMVLNARHSIAFGEPKSPLERSPEDLVEEAIVRNDSLIFERTFQHLQMFAADGLRVLLYGHRFVSTDEYMSWKKIYHEATTAFSERQAKIEKAAELIETGFDLTGATAIEDKLQDGVPQTIEKLRRAGIHIWMLTGDKRETAVNIGHSCGLIKDYSTTIMLDHNDPEMAGTMATRTLQIVDEQIPHSVVVVDGATLATIESDLGLMSLFLDLCVEASSVICCRASPAQKATLVAHVRKQVSHAVTLAIGDGANDIAMIREAHVGIGITGKEGLQAARASDYSIAQFRFLLKLLLVHGRWNYVRISKYILGTFYKEIFLFLTQAVFQRYVGYTGTSLHENWSLSTFNTLFSSLCVICLGAFEKDLSAVTLLAVPELYETGRLGKAFSMRQFFGWMTVACTQSVVMFYCAELGYGRWNTGDLYPLGNMVFTAAVIIINCKLLFLEIHSWSILNFAFFAITVGGWFGWTVMLNFIYGYQPLYFVKGALTHHFGRKLSWWAGLLFTLIFTLLVDVIAQCVRVMFFPTQDDIFRELQADAAGKARLEEEAAMELQNTWQADKEREDEREVEEILRRRALVTDEEAGFVPRDYQFGQLRQNLDHGQGTHEPGKSILRNNNSNHRRAGSHSIAPVGMDEDIASDATPGGKGTVYVSTRVV